MHNKLAGTKGFGRTIKIHNTPLPPRPHAHVPHACSFTTYIRTKVTKKNQQQHGLTNQYDIFSTK